MYRRMDWQEVSEVPQDFTLQNASHTKTQSIFGCIRFRNSPFAAVANVAGKGDCMAIDGTIRPLAFVAAEQTAERYINALRDTHDGQTPGWGLVVANALTQITILHAVFLSAGMQVFQFTRPMIDEFKRTELSDTPIGRLHLPYSAGYLHFGIQTDLSIKDDWRLEPEYLDGAYYHCGPDGQLTIQLCLTREHARGSGIPGPHFSIDPIALRLPAHEAISQALTSEKEQAKLAVPSQSFQDAYQHWDDAAREVLHASLSLVINALFYLDAYGADTGEVVPEDAPEDLRLRMEKALASGKSKAVREARNSMLAQGFTVVRLCGTKLDGIPSNDVARGQGPVRTHWRRGHWRMQPHGPSLSLIKRVWVRPALVGKNNGMPATGHHYIAVKP